MGTEAGNWQPSPSPLCIQRSGNNELKALEGMGGSPEDGGLRRSRKRKCSWRATPHGLACWFHQGYEDSTGTTEAEGHHQGGTPCCVSLRCFSKCMSVDALSAWMDTLHMHTWCQGGLKRPSEPVNQRCRCCHGYRSSHCPSLLSPLSIPACCL